jgi:hypothetical protein
VHGRRSVPTCGCHYYWKAELTVATSRWVDTDNRPPVRGRALGARRPSIPGRLAAALLLSAGLWPLPGLGATVSFQDGVQPTAAYTGTRDATLSENEPDTTLGTGAELEVDGDDPRGSGRDLSSLLRWDLSVIPPGSLVESVELTVEVTNRSKRSFGIYELLTAWIEAESTWNESGAGSPWQVPGAQGPQERGATLLGSVEASSVGSHTVFLNSAGLAAVQRWVNDPASNHGLLISDPIVSDGLRFASREALAAAARPRLTVTYSASGPDADGDGVPDDQDAFPNDPTEWEDTDGDGLGNNADPDDDDDAMPDVWELLHGFDPFDPSDADQDADGDGVSNLDEFLQGTDPRGGLVGRWQLDEGSGTTLTDTSGFGNDGSFAGLAAWTSGVSGAALDFAGSGDLVLVPDDVSLDLTDAITIAAWLRPNRVGTQYVIKKAQKGATDGYELSLSSSGGLFVRFNQASSGNAYRLNSLSGYPVDGSTWVHVAATYDGQQIKLYVDGALEGSLSAPGLVIGVNDVPLSIGGQFGGVRLFDGAVDEVHLYDRALSAHEVVALAMGNGAPAVDAGSDTTVRLPTDSVALDGTVTDDGQPIPVPVVTWSGPPGVSFADPGAVDTTATFPGAGTYVVQLTASDTEFEVSDAVTVVVEAAPVLSGITLSPGSASLLPGQSQGFAASGSDQYGDPFPVSPGWSATGGFIDQGGNYTAGIVVGSFLVTATDGAVSGSASVTIARSPPLAEAGGPYTGEEGDAIPVDGSGSADADNDIVAWEWDFDGDEAYDDASGAIATFSAGGSGVFTIGLRVTDVDGASDVDTATVTVDNAAPQAEAGGPYSGDQGSNMSLDASGSSDPGDDIVSYDWDLDADGLYDDASGVAVGFDTAAPGVFTVGLRVSDADGAVGMDTASVMVNDVAPAAPTGLVATGRDGQVDLDWDDNVEPDLAGYRVYRSEVPGGPYEHIAGLLASNSHADTGLSNETTYYYVVTAEDVAGNESALPDEVASTPGADAGLVGYWRLDEGSGTTLTDTSGFGNDGSFGGLAAWTSGVSGAALDFAGSGDLMLVPDDVSLDLTDAITIAAWLRPTRIGTQYVIKKALKGDINGYELSLSSSGGLFVRFNQASSGNGYRLNSLSGYPVDGSSWIHVAATYDGQQIKLYVDGALEASLSAPGLVIGVNDVPLSVGAQFGGARPFDGAVDEVLLYGRALSQVEVQDLITMALPSDRDGDGVPDDEDTFPDDPTEWEDADGDGIGNNADDDDDDDGIPDSWELQHGFDPFDSGDADQDADGDGVSNRDEFLQGTDPRSSEVGGWVFDEGSGTAAADASGFGNDGTLIGSPTWSPGVSGSALEFGGDGGRVVVPDEASLDLTDSITIAAWVRPGQTEAQSLVQKARLDAFDGYELGLSPAGSVFVRFNQASTGDLHRLDSVGSYPDTGTTWIHVAATYDGQEIRLYLDGLLESSRSAPGLLIGANDLPLSIGAQEDGVGAFLGGLDQVHVYATALSAQEIQNLIASEELPDLESWSVFALQSTPTQGTTGEKPQSKVWRFADTWWAVFADEDATWLWRLDSDRWSNVLQLSSSRNAKADYELDGDLVHVLLFEGSATQLVSAEYVPGSPGTYRLWSARPGPVDIPLSDSGQAATLAVDTTGRMWVAYDTRNSVEVRYGDPVDDYTSWSAPVVLESHVAVDDLVVCTAFDGQVGVLWSNQQIQRFGFRTHLDADPPDVWGADEVPASQSALNVGLGMADNHVNLASSSLGTLYAAVKTGYDTGGHPRIALLVRRPSGTWDDLYEVDTGGTRPIVVLNDVLGSVVVIYTTVAGGGDIVYRVSDATSVSFGPRRTLIEGFASDNASSTKQSFVYELIVIAKGDGEVRGASLAPW